MHEFYGSSQESEDDEPPPDDRVRQLQRYNVRIQGQEAF